MVKAALLADSPTVTLTAVITPSKGATILAPSSWSLTCSRLISAVSTLFWAWATAVASGPASRASSSSCAASTAALAEARSASVVWFFRSARLACAERSDASAEATLEAVSVPDVAAADS